LAFSELPQGELARFTRRRDLRASHIFQKSFFSGLLTGKFAPAQY
jgi:hypothetical protein